jgi:hypothetical protein
MESNSRNKNATMIELYKILKENVDFESASSPQSLSEDKVLRFI